ncbi:hypothetical protein ACFQ1S_38800, partial [Kibdelosporangium lantanae]
MTTIMNAPSTRMLTLLSLLQDGRAWQGAELAERLTDVHSTSKICPVLTSSSNFAQTVRGAGMWYS